MSKRSGTYAWRRRKPGKRSRENAVLSTLILGIHKTMDKRYKVRNGVRRMHAELRTRPWIYVHEEKKRVRWLMRQMGLYGTHYRRPYNHPREGRSRHPGSCQAQRCAQEGRNALGNGYS